MTEYQQFTLDIENATNAICTVNKRDNRLSEYVPFENLIKANGLKFVEATDGLQIYGIRSAKGNWSTLLSKHGAVVTVQVLKSVELESPIQRTYTVELLSPDGARYVSVYLRHLLLDIIKRTK